MYVYYVANVCSYITLILVTIEICPPLTNPTNGRVYIIDDRQTALFVCNSGYTVIGNARASCVDGTWNSSSPVCRP